MGLRDDPRWFVGDPVGAVLQFLQEVLRFFETLAPGGFGLVLIP